MNNALDKGDIDRAFAILKPDTVEVPFSEGPTTASKLWADLKSKDRKATLLLASGRAMRSAVNAAVQQERLKRGELEGPGLRHTVLDRVTVTREGARHMKGYRTGRVVLFRTNLPNEGIARGDRGVVQGTDKGQVLLAMADGSRRRFEPGRLPRNLAHDAVTIHEPKPLRLYPGDRIRWTDNDRDRGLLNGDLATIWRIEKNGITLTTAKGEQVQLGAQDPMRERLDLAYAVNVHIAQGMTARRGIILMSEREKPLNTARAFLVAVTRIAERATLVVDHVAAPERDIQRRSGDKSSALETAGNKGSAAQPTTRQPPEKVRQIEREKEIGW